MPNNNNVDKIEQLWEKSYPKGARREIKIPERTVYSLLQDTVLKKGNAVSIDFIGKKYTYAQLKEMVDEAAVFLSDLGVKQYDRVGIMVPNSPIYIIMYFALCKLGAVVVQINPLYTSFEISVELADSNADIIITLDDFYEKVSGLRKKYLNKIVICRIQDYLPGAVGFIYSLGKSLKGKRPKIPKSGDIIYFKHTKKLERELREVKINPLIDPAVIQYTGGTTGTPKGALLSHENLVSNVYQLNEWIPEVDRRTGFFLAAIPYFHVYGMMTSMLLPIFLGSEILIVPDPRDTKRILDTMKKEKSIIFPGIPTMYHSMLRYLKGKKGDLSNLSILLSGAAPMAADLERQFTSRTKGKIIEGYGLTEASPVVCATPVDPAKRKFGTVGFPLPNTEVKIVDIETGTKEMELGEMGELIVKGPQVMLGYLNRKEETDQTIREGWLYTGDIGLIDKEGYISIVDRKKDMIIAGGYNVYPREIEEVLMSHPSIDEASVIGVRDPHRGETVKAYIVLREGKKLNQKDVVSYCSQKLAIYKIPKSVEFVDSLPKSIVGKVLKRELVERNNRAL